MRFRYRPDGGFGSELEVRVGWWSMNYSRFQDHVYVHFLWARPLVKTAKTSSNSWLSTPEHASK